MDRYSPAALELIDGDIKIPVRPLIATAADPIACTSWDLGAPEVRITSTPRPGADGVDEGGGYLGSRTVTLELLIRGDGAAVAGGHDPYWYADQLTAMCHPSRRPVLAITRNSETSRGVTWYLGLRGNPWSMTIDRASAARLAMTLSFTAPAGLLESDLHQVVSPTGNDIASTDWRFPAHFPKGFGLTSADPTVTCTISGTGPVAPTLYINGPITNPRIRDDLGNVFAFTGLTLVTGQTVRIDMAAGTVLVADPETGWNNTSADVWHTVDFEDSTFWQWPTGTRKVALLSETGSFSITWRDRQLSI